MRYGYIRVSCDKQTVENQRYEIKQFCQPISLPADADRIQLGNVWSTILLTRKIGNFYYKTKKIAQTLANVKDIL